MNNWILTLINKPKTSEDAMALGHRYWSWWCEQRGVIELPTDPENRNPFLKEEYSIKGVGDE